MINDQADIERLMQQLSLEQHQYSLTKELLTLSQKTYVLLEEQYRLGKITYLDLITGLNDLLDAKTGFLSTHFSSLQSVAHYRFYEGTLYEAIEK
ncbi:MAG: TolC family protein [Bdellovibrionota bacterium]